MKKNVKTLYPIAFSNMSVITDGFKNDAFKLIDDYMNNKVQSLVNFRFLSMVEMIFV